jgi:hypothetical protein
MISMYHTVTVILYFYLRPLSSGLEFMKCISCELIITITITLILVLGVDDELAMLQYNDRFQIGWAIIILIILVLFVQILIYVRINITEVVGRVKKII